MTIMGSGSHQYSTVLYFGCGLRSLHLSCGIVVNADYAIQALAFSRSHHIYLTFEDTKYF
jgi:hypothetical protein